MRLRKIGICIVAGSVLGIVAAVALLLMFRREQFPEITGASLEEAAARWAEHGPKNYDLEIELSGVNPGTAQVEVRKGEVVRMLLNGRPTRPHTWDDWSAPGLFAVIRRDLEACAEAAKKNGGGMQPVFSRGVFDPHYGYPLVYRRITPTGSDAQWRVIRFSQK